MVTRPCQQRLQKAPLLTQWQRKTTDLKTTALGTGTGWVSGRRRKVGNTVVAVTWAVTTENGSLVGRVLGWRQVLGGASWLERDRHRVVMRSKGAAEVLTAEAGEGARPGRVSA